jgi:nicotinate-nucleotide adenylyltransferase
VKNLGILGGTFDPPHLAHLIAGERAVEAFELDTLFFIPANIPPHKAQERISSGEHRFAMTQLATQGNDKFEVSRIELNRPGISYTIDTLHEIKQKFSPEKIFLFIGLDQLAIFNTWHESEEIFKAAKVVVMTRPLQKLDEIDPFLVSGVKILSLPLLEISSTDIRARVREGKSVRYLVPEGVREYIAKHKLYRQSSG